VLITESMLAKTLEQILGRPIETACDLIESLLGKPFEVAGAALADQVQIWQWRNRIRIAERAQAIMEQRGIARRILPPDFLLPLLRECGDTSDETLQEAWARLLSEAVADETIQHVGFIHTLRQLAPNDAKVLNNLIELGPLDVKERVPKLSEVTGMSPDRVQLSLGNLQRLGFFTPTGKRLKHFGVRFLRVCLVENEKLDKYLTSQKEIERRIVMD
jgi:hypothetical protein